MLLPSCPEKPCLLLYQGWTAPNPWDSQVLPFLADPVPVIQPRAETRRSFNAASTLKNTYERPKTATKILVTSINWAMICVLPPYNKPVTADSTPFQAAVSGLPFAKIPTASTPQIPLKRWTGTAPTGSSILSFSIQTLAQQTITPATRPITTAAHQSTKAQGAVMATRPARIPLTDMPGSGFFVEPNNHI